MAVHHFTAPGIVVARGWQPIETFPKDGRVVEIREGDGPPSRATWRDGRLHVDADGTHNPTHWRSPE
jgi:hypothetical protein